MKPKFFVGDIIVVDPDIKPGHNHYVIATKRDHNHSILRQLLVVEDVSLLATLNPGWPNGLQKLSKAWIIQGTVVSKHREL